jgi:RHS repeat-associated protein
MTTDYLWDVNRSLPVVLDDGTNTYVYGLDLVSATDGSSDQTYYQYDGLGSTVALADDTGTITDTYSYDVFGAVRASTGSTPNPWLFTSEQYDPDSGLYYLRARYYDPGTGRFLGRDPLEAAEPYAYVGNNPLIWTDSSGLDKCPYFSVVCIPPIQCHIPFAGSCEKATDSPGQDLDAAITFAESNYRGQFVNQLIGVGIAFASDCGKRTEKEGGIVIYEQCTGGFAHLFSSLNHGHTFTVGSFIFSPGTLSGPLLAHELCHVNQYDHWGIGFLPTYFAVELLPGTNPFESSADRCAGTHFYD